MVNKDGRQLGFGLGLLIFAASAVAVYFYFPQGVLAPRSCGLFLPSPPQWAIPRLWGMVIQCALLLATGLLVLWGNHKYNYTQSQALTPGAVFFLLTAGCPWLTTSLSAAPMISLLTIAGLLMLFGRIDRSGAQPEFFLIGALIALGTLSQYAFLLLLPMFVLAGIALRLFRWREFLALLLGVVATPWCAIGLGLVNPLDFHLPPFEDAFRQWQNMDSFLVVCIMLAVVALITVLLCLSNFIRLYSASSSVRRMNHVFTMVSIWVVACMCVDFPNFMAYSATLFAAAAIQTATAFAFTPHRSVAQGGNSAILLALGALCITLLILTLIYY